MPQWEKVNARTLELIQLSEFGPNYVKLPEIQLHYEKEYTPFAEVVERLGGKWERKSRKHIFPYDPKPLMESVLENGVMPPKNPTAFFPTPKPVVDNVILCADLTVREVSSLHYVYERPVRILEPSAGMGAIADGVRQLLTQGGLVEGEHFQIDTVEYLPTNIGVLRSKGYKPFEGDFLEYKPEYKYEFILMNPPFSLEGDTTAYITHFMYAYELLADNGRIACVTPVNYQFGSAKAFVAMRSLVRSSGGNYEKNPDGAFKESGTGTATLIVYLQKSNQEWRRCEFNGWPSWYCWAMFTYTTDEPAYQSIWDEYQKRFDILGYPARDENGIFVHPDKAIAMAKEIYSVGMKQLDVYHEPNDLADSDWLYLMNSFIDTYINDRTNMHSWLDRNYADTKQTVERLRAEPQTQEVKKNLQNLEQTLNGYEYLVNLKWENKQDYTAAEAQEYKIPTAKKPVKAAKGKESTEPEETIFKEETPVLEDYTSTEPLDESLLDLWD